MGHTYVGFSMLLAGLLALTACEVDPDEDRPGQPTVPNPNPPDTGGDTGGDTGDTGGDTGTDDSDDGDTTEPPGGTSCLGHCDCALNEYCAAVGVCQLMVVPGPYYCCTQPDRCIAGQECDEPNPDDGVGICPAAR